MGQKRKIKKAAIPEYIWYVSLIAITLGLVVVINSITSKSTKQATSVKQGAPFTVASMSISAVAGKVNTVSIDELVISPKVSFKKSDLNALYLECEKDPTRYAKVTCLKLLQDGKINSTQLKICNPEDDGYVVDQAIFVLEGTGVYNLLSSIEVTKDSWNISDECFKKGTKWFLFYSDPAQGGTRVYETTVS